MLCVDATEQGFRIKRDSASKAIVLVSAVSASADPEEKIKK